MTEPTFKELREEERDKLAALSREIEAFINRYKDKDRGVALRAELNVRQGKRAVGRVFRQARALAQIADPEPYHTAPTRERQVQAGEDAKVAVVYEAGQAQSVNHRWQWPVEKAHRLHQLNPAMYMAAARLRRAFFDLGRPGTMYYGDDRRITDPARRTPTTEERKAAERMFRYVWPRLEDDLKAVAWVLVLQQPLPNDSEPLSIVAFGKTISGSATEEHARWFALGAMKIVLRRLQTIVHHYDLAEAKEKAEAERRIANRKSA